MARSSTTGDNAGSTAQSARFTVALPKDVGESIDKLAAKLSESMRQQHGIGVELSRAQVVTSVVTSALKTLEDAEGAPQRGDE